MLEPITQSNESQEADVATAEEVLPDAAELDSLTAELDQIDSDLGDLAG